MILKSLSLRQFRCYQEQSIELDPRFNVIVGLNGQGKTSVLEAAGLIASLRSFRLAKNAEMIRHGTQASAVSAEMVSEGISLQLDVKIWPNRKHATINGKTCRFISEYIEKIAAVSFSPSDLEIIRGGPEFRRSWIDKLSQVFNRSHVDISAQFQKALEQRNKLLKKISDFGPVKASLDELEIWTEQLIRFGAQVIHNRIQTVDNSAEKIAEFYGKISGQNTVSKQTVNIEYQSKIFEINPCGQAPGISLELINQLLESHVRSARDKELLLGTSLVGPHRDDLNIFLDQKSVKAFGSQGEIRSLVLALRLAEVELHKERLHCNPILLIDDFSSELDARRRQQLLDYLEQSDSQVFLSTTETMVRGKVFVAHDGKLENLNGYSTDRSEQLQRR